METRAANVLNALRYPLFKAAEFFQINPGKRRHLNKWGHPIAQLGTSESTSNSGNVTPPTLHPPSAPIPPPPQHNGNDPCPPPPHPVGNDPPPPPNQFSSSQTPPPGPSSYTPPPVSPSQPEPEKIT